MRLYIGLLHYPVYNKNYQRIASAITNFDLHDLSRLARTYDVKRFFVITPLEDQRKLAERIVRHWTIGYGARYNKYRKEAFERLAVVSSLETSCQKISSMEGEPPQVIATDASAHGGESITYAHAAEILHSGRVALLLFGTAWGLAGEVIKEADYLLEPIQGPADYNHLSVRTAAAIILDRLAGSYSAA